jgi:hypothetical protein
VPNQQPNGQLQTQHSLDAGSYIIDKHKLQASTGGRGKKIIIIIPLHSCFYFILHPLPYYSPFSVILFCPLLYSSLDPSE